MDRQDAKALRTTPLQTPTDLKSNAVRDIAGALNILLADMFALYLKTKNFHWHVSGPHFRDYHLLRDEQADQIFATTDAIFAAQEDWSARGSRFETVNSARISAYPRPAQFRALADGSGLSDLMRKRGMTDAGIEACLNNEAELAVIVKNTDAAWAKIHGTPAFELNGKTIDTTEWAVLEKSLRAAGAK